MAVVNIASPIGTHLKGFVMVIVLALFVLIPNTRPISASIRIRLVEFGVFSQCLKLLDFDSPGALFVPFIHFKLTTI